MNLSIHAPVRLFDIASIPLLSTKLLQTLVDIQKKWYEIEDEQISINDINNSIDYALIINLKSVYALRKRSFHLFYIYTLTAYMYMDSISNIFYFVYLEQRWNC